MFFSCAKERGSNFFLPGKAPSAGNAFFPQAGLARGLHLQARTLPYALFLWPWAVPVLLLHQPSALLCGSMHPIPLQGHVTLQKGGRPPASAEGPASALERGRPVLATAPIWQLQSTDRTGRTAQEAGWPLLRPHVPLSCPNQLNGSRAPEKSRVLLAVHQLEPSQAHSRVRAWIYKMQRRLHVNTPSLARQNRSIYSSFLKHSYLHCLARNVVIEAVIATTTPNSSSHPMPAVCVTAGERDRVIQAHLAFLPWSISSRW